MSIDQIPPGLYLRTRYEDPLLGEVREREYAVRRSLGASRGRLVTHLFTESLVLALAGGALGVLLAAICIRLLPVLAPAGIPRIDEVGVNLPVLAAALEHDPDRRPSSARGFAQLLASAR